MSATITPTTATQSNQIATVTPTQDPLPSRRCPAINGTTYTATNKPYPIDRTQIPNSTLKFEILCDMDHGALDYLQLIANVSTLNDCFDLCALYDFQMDSGKFPAHACTAVSWGHAIDENLYAGNTCWLNNITGSFTGSSQHIQPHIGYDSGILLLDTWAFAGYSVWFIESQGSDDKCYHSDNLCFHSFWSFCLVYNVRISGTVG